MEADKMEDDEEFEQEIELEENAEEGNMMIEEEVIVEEGDHQYQGYHGYDEPDHGGYYVIENGVENWVDPDEEAIALTAIKTRNACLAKRSPASKPGRKPSKAAIDKVGRTQVHVLDGTTLNTEDYPGVNILSFKCIVDFSEAAATLLCKEDMPEEIVSLIPPPHAPRLMKSVSFLVDLWALNHPKDLCVDSEGNWGRFWCSSAYYIYCTDDSAQRVDCAGEKLSPTNYDARIMKMRYKHPNTKGNLCKYIFVVRNKREKLNRWAIVSYRWIQEPMEFTPAPAGVEKSFLENVELSAGGEHEAIEDVEEFIENFGPGVHVFSSKCLGEFKVTAPILLLTEEAEKNLVCSRVPPRAPLEMSECTFLVDLRKLENPRDVFVDSHGYWGKSSGLHAYYCYEGDTVSRVDDDGKLSPEASNSWDAKVLKVRYRHLDTDSKLMKHIFTARDREGQMLRWALVAYKWTDNAPCTFTPSRGRGKGMTRKKRHLEPTEYCRHLEPDRYQERLKELRGELGHHSDDPSGTRDLWPEQEGEFADGISLFGAKAITDVRDCVDLLLKLDLDQLPTCKRVPEGASLQRTETCFVVDLKALELPGHVFQDAHGSWGKPHGVSIYYKSADNEIKKVGAGPECDHNFKVTKCRYKHPNAAGKLLKYIFTVKSPNGGLYRWALVSYRWEDVPFPFQPGSAYKGTRCTRLDPNKSRNEEEVEEVEDETEFEGVKGSKLFDTLDALTEDKSESFRPGEPQASEESEIIDPEEIFPPGVLPFSPKVVSNFAEAAELMIRKVASGPVCTVVPPSAPLKMRTITYLVDLQELADPRDVFVDHHGVWGKVSGSSAYYKYNEWGVTKVEAPYRGGNPDVKMTKTRYKHTQTKLKLKKTIYTAQNQNEEFLRWALISYRWDCEPFAFKPKPHGNSKNTDRPFQPTKPSARNRIRELALLYTPQRAISEYLNEKGQDVNSSESSDIPRNVHQASNLGRFPRSIHRAAQKIAKNSKTTIRQFPTKRNIYAVLDETMNEDEPLSYSVTKSGKGNYTCNCDEFKSCFICRHSLAVARINDEWKTFIDSTAEKMKDPANLEDSQVLGTFLASGFASPKKRGRPPIKREWDNDEDEDVGNVVLVDEKAQIAPPWTSRSSGRQQKHKVHIPIPHSNTSDVSYEEEEDDYEEAHEIKFKPSKMIRPSPAINTRAKTIRAAVSSAKAKGSPPSKGNWRRKELKTEQALEIRKSGRKRKAKVL